MVGISPAVLASDRHQLLEDTVVTLETNGRIKRLQRRSFETKNSAGMRTSDNLASCDFYEIDVLKVAFSKYVPYRIPRFLMDDALPLE